MAMEMKQLYVWGSPTEMIDSQYGKISYKDWLHKEADRINADPARKAEVKARKHDGKMCLLVNKVCEEVEGEE